MVHDALVFGAFSALAGLSMYIVRGVSSRVGFVSQVVADRWNPRSVPLGGGIAMTLLLLAGLVWIDRAVFFSLGPPLVILFALGLVDDLKSLGPSSKLVWQTLAAAYVTSQGYVLPLPWHLVAIPVTIVWIVGLTNALNLIDNIDGLAGGVTAISALGLALLLRTGPRPDDSHAVLAMVTAAIAVGFLFHNFHPARIFMGDAGSLPIGFTLATLATTLRFSDQAPGVLALAPIALVLVVPVFDIVLVMIARGTASRPLMLGGRDHSSHRLVGLGLGDTRAVLLLYLLGIAGCAAAFLGARGSTTVLLIVTGTMLVATTLFGAFLLEVAVYNPPVERDRPLRWREGPRNLPMPILYALEVVVDICAISLVWALAHLMRFGDEGGSAFASQKANTIIPILPFLITIKLACFSLFHLYRGLWRKVVTEDVFQILKASSLASLLLIAVCAFMGQLTNVSRIVLVLDWLLTFLAILWTRAAIGAFRSWSQRLAVKPFRSAFVGLPGLAPVVKRAIDEESGIDFAGVITTTGDRSESGGPILGDASLLESLVEQQEIDILFFADSTGFEDAFGYLSAKGVMIRRVRVELG